MNINDIIRTAFASNVDASNVGTDNIQIQPDSDSDIGSFGSIQAKTEHINILQDLDGNIQIETDVVCLTLKPAVVKALKIYLNNTEEQ